VRTNITGVDMSDGGKGSNPRPFSVDQKTFDSNWDKIFKKNNYQDVLSTEDCVLDALKEMNRVSDECGDYITNEIDISKNNPE
jgi:hypothetical protein